MSEPLLTVRGIEKSFPGVRALEGVDFAIRTGRVHALVGENGAGKSTLAKIIAGLHQAGAGEMFLQDRPYKPVNKASAEAAGVRMVMQELNLIANLSVAENLFLRRLPSRLGVVNFRKLNDDARAIMKRVGLDVDPSVRVSALGTGQQQMVEIAAGLSQKCRLLILDEPTASLTDAETDLLFDNMQRLKNQGVGIIYISHRLEEIKRIADEVTVLRDGRIVATRGVPEITTDEIVRLMVGRDLSDERLDRKSAKSRTALRVENLWRGDKVRNASFEARTGEILGFAGLMGSGRTETMRCIFGADRPDGGSIYLGESQSPTKIESPGRAVANRIAFLTEDRKEQGLLLPLDIRTNITITNLGAVSRLAMISGNREDAAAEKYRRSLAIRCPSVRQKVSNLSGGNQQKVVIAKWLYRDADVFIFDEPTRGIDVGAKFEIYKLLGRLADEGKSIIVVSSDLIELMAICDRIAVMSAGKLAKIFDRGRWTQEEIMAAALSEHIGAAPENRSTA